MWTSRSMWVGAILVVISLVQTRSISAAESGASMHSDSLARAGLYPGRWVTLRTLAATNHEGRYVGLDPVQGFCVLDVGETSKSPVLMSVALADINEVTMSSRVPSPTAVLLTASAATVLGVILGIRAGQPDPPRGDVVVGGHEAEYGFLGGLLGVSLGVPLGFAIAPRRSETRAVWRREN